MVVECNFKVVTFVCNPTTKEVYGSAWCARKNSNDTVIKVGSFIDVDINRRQFIFESSTLEKIDHNTAYFTVFYGSVQ